MNQTKHYSFAVVSLVSSAYHFFLLHHLSFWRNNTPQLRILVTCFHDEKGKSHLRKGCVKHLSVKLGWQTWVFFFLANSEE
jgi:hypothetical protein